MSNPLLNDRFAENVGIIEGEVMTINGTINKTLLMLFMLVISASYTWMLTLQGFVDKAQMLGYAGAFVALVSIIAMYFTKKASGIWAVIYSVAEGFFLGYLSALIEFAVRSSRFKQLKNFRAVHFNIHPFFLLIVH